MSDAEKKPPGGVTLLELIEHWNTVAPRMDALAQRFQLNLDSCAAVSNARKVIGGFLQDCQEMAAMQGKQEERSPEERKVIEDAARILREKAEAAGVPLRKVEGEPDPDPEPERSEEAATEATGGHEAATA